MLILTIPPYDSMRIQVRIHSPCIAFPPLFDRISFHSDCSFTRIPLITFVEGEWLKKRTLMSRLLLNWSGQLLVMHGDSRDSSRLFLGFFWVFVLFLSSMLVSRAAKNKIHISFWITLTLWCKTKATEIRPFNHSSKQRFLRIQFSFS